jgi:mRNA interferase RelE/StbE
VTYQLAVSSTAEKQLRRLPERVANAVVEFMVGPLIEDPLVCGKPLKPPLDGLHSARRGNYRIIYRVDQRIVVVLRIAHRSHVYRP